MILFSSLFYFKTSNMEIDEAMSNLNVITYLRQGKIVFCLEKHGKHILLMRLCAY